MKHLHDFFCNHSVFPTPEGKRARFLATLLLIGMLALAWSVRSSTAQEESNEKKPAAGHSTVPRPSDDTSSGPAVFSPETSRLPSTQKNPSRTTIEQAPIDIYLKDQDGNLVFVPNFPLENLDEIYRAENTADEVPDYVLQLLANGKVEGGYVKLQLHFWLFAQNKPNLVVPLRMPEGVLQLPDEEPQKLSELVEYRGPGECQLFFDRDQGGYVCHIRQDESLSQDAGDSTVPTATSPPLSAEETSDDPEEGEISGREEETGEKESENKDDVDEHTGSPSSTAGETTTSTTVEDDRSPHRRQYHEIIFELCFPVESVGEEESHLNLTFPRTISSKLKLEVPLANAVAEVNRGVILDTESRLSSAHTLFTISGIQDHFELQWRKFQNASVEVPTILQVKDAVITAMLNNREVNFEAVLPVESYRGTFDHFRVRLPDGAAWIPENHSQYSIREIRKQTDDGRGSLLEVRLPQETDQTVYVHLKARGVLPPESADGWYELGGFDVLEAEKQYGKIAVGTLDDWRLQWKMVRWVRDDDLRLEELPEEHLPESFREEQLTAGFAYYRQPCSLKAQVVLRQTNINVKPEYQITINKGQVTLNGRLTYQVHGAETNRMVIDMPGWLSPEIGPPNIVDVDAFSFDDSGRLTVPLLVPSDGIIQIDLKAYRKMDPEAEAIELEMPRPEADWFEPASIAILPADNVELTPNSEAIRGMSRKVRKSLSLEMELPEGQNTPLFYQQESQEAKFSADITFHTQKIDVASSTEVRLNAGNEQIIQNLTYDIAYEPIDRLTLWVPRELAESGDWKVTLDSFPLTPQSLPSGNASTGPPDEETEYVKRRVFLPQTRIGSCVLSIRSSFNPIELQPEMTIPVRVPLIMPGEGNLTDNQVTAVVPSGVNVQLMGDADDTWHPQKEHLDESMTAHVGTWIFETNQKEFHIPFGVYLADRDVLGDTGVRRAWIQSWFLGPDRFDRAVYQLMTNRRHVGIQLPSGVDPRKITVRLDGKSLASSKLDSNNTLSVTLPESSQEEHFLLELWYQIPNRTENQSLVRVELPRLLDEIWVRRMYWQVILPEYHHLASFSHDLTSEFQWGWKGGFWGRVPNMSQEDLEVWIGAEKMDPIPDGTSCYLFSSMGTIENPELRIVQRSTVVLVASGLALVLGLLIVYFPVLRYPGVLLCLGVILLAAIAFRPAPALLVAQAAGIGVFMALMGGYLYRIFSRKDRWSKGIESTPSDSSQGSQKIETVDDEDSSESEDRPAEHVHSTVSNYDPPDSPSHYDT